MNKKNKSRYETVRKVLIFWCLFIGIGAVAGATGMLIKPDGSALGMQSLLPMFQVLPFAGVLFQNFIFPGIALLCVNGITNLTAAVLLLARKKAGIYLGGIFGITLMLWIIIQFVIFPANFMDISYFLFGLIQAITGYICYVFYEQEHFVLTECDYSHIGTDKTQAVVYFSRMGYTKKLAYEAADKSGACIYEITAVDRTDGTLGFWWCGRFGMHAWAMDVNDCGVDFSSFDKVTVCSPVWVFRLSAPVRAFCKTQSGKIKKADYILVHHQKSAYEGAFDEMDALLGIKHENARSVRCRLGKYTEIALHK